jgi:Spy/CpxP family protein refolding chaperone
MKFNKTKILTAAVVFLLLVNLTTLAGIWPYIDLKTFTFAPPSPATPKQFIIDKLDLSEEQQKIFEELRKEHFEEIDRLQASIIDEKEAMYDLLKSNTPDTIATYNHMATMMRDEERLERLTIEHFRKVRAICDDEQKQHFDVIIDKIMKMTNKTHRRQPLHESPSDNAIQPLP